MSCAEENLRVFHNQGIQVVDEDLTSAMVVVVSIILSAVILFLSLIFSSKAEAQVVEPTLAVRAIIGEASNQGYEGMLAVACAIRNRGTLEGVYGKSSAHIDNEPVWVWEMARKAWNESKIVDLTNGATHWESDRFPEPYWAKSMVKTVKIKNHQFYKEG